MKNFGRRKSLCMKRLWKNWSAPITWDEHSIWSGMGLRIIKKPDPALPTGIGTGTRLGNINKAVEDVKWIMDQPQLTDKLEADVISLDGRLKKDLYLQCIDPFQKIQYAEESAER